MSENSNEQTPDIAAELGEVGRKLRETISTAWNSEERENIQKEVQEGLRRFSAELEGAIETVRTSDPGQKVETGVKHFREDVKSGKVSDDIRGGIVTGLRAISGALDKLAENFTPVEGEKVEEKKAATKKKTTKKTTKDK